MRKLPSFFNTSHLPTRIPKRPYIKSISPQNSRRKLAVFGAGEVTKQMLVHIASQLKDIHQPLDIVVHNRCLKHAQSLLMDVESAFGHLEKNTRLTEQKGLKIHVTESYADTHSADICVIAIGSKNLHDKILPKGLSQNIRDTMSLANFDGVMNIANHIKNYSPDALVIMMSSQPDFLAEQCASILPRHQLLGFGGAIDSARFRLCLKKELAKFMPVENVSGHIIGYHNQDMFSLSSSIMIDDLLIHKLLPKEQLTQLLARVINETRAYGLKVTENNRERTTPSIGPGVKLAEAVLQLLYEAKPSFIESFCCYVDTNSEAANFYNISGFISVPVQLKKLNYEIQYNIPLTSDELALLQQANANHKATSQLILEQLGRLNNRSCNIC